MNHAIEQIFPNLTPREYRIASPSTPGYNCIAWAAGEDDVWWWPDPMQQAYWPSAVARAETLEAFVQAFETLGYVPGDSSEVEQGFEKIAIYVDSAGTPKHVARQLANGKWTSKLGSWEDIEHGKLEDLTGATYGSVRCILRRKI